MSSLQVIDIHMKNQWYIKEYLTDKKKQYFAVAQFEPIFYLCSPLYKCTYVLSLSYMWCQCDAAATLELDQSATHTLDGIRPKSRTGTAMEILHT